MSISSDNTKKTIIGIAINEPKMINPCDFTIWTMMSNGSGFCNTDIAVQTSVMFMLVYLTPLLQIL